MNVERALEAVARSIANLDARLRHLDNTRPKLQAWQAPTLLNSWVNGGVGFSTAGYWKDPHGLVHLRGHINGGGTGSQAFSLPPDYRPEFGMLVHAFSDALVEVLSTGSVSIAWTGTSDTILDGITFRAFA